MHRFGFCIGTLLVAVAATASSAIDITTGGNTDSKLAERGQSPSGCREPKLKRRTPIRGEWIALTSNSLRITQLYATNAKVLSAPADEKFFFTGVPLRPGKVQNATVKSLPTGTTARTEAEIVLGESRYRFVEWGAWGFALQTLTPLPTVLPLQVFGVDEPRIPKEAFVRTQQSRDTYDPGVLKLIRAADLNGDGVVDLLLRYHSKEAEGLMLWLSAPGSKRHLEPIYSATAYGDC